MNLSPTNEFSQEQELLFLEAQFYHTEIVFHIPFPHPITTPDVHNKQLRKIFQFLDYYYLITPSVLPVDLKMRRYFICEDDLKKKAFQDYETQKDYIIARYCKNEVSFKDTRFCLNRIEQNRKTFNDWIKIRFSQFKIKD